MSPAPSRDGSRSPERGLYRRLAAYSRYVALVHAQEEAVDQGDLERFTELGEVREELQEELEESLSEHEQALVSADSETRGLLEQALAALRAAMARDERTRNVLATLRRETAGRIRTMGSRKGQVSRYLESQEPGGPRPVSRLNRKG